MKFIFSDRRRARREPARRFSHASIASIRPVPHSRLRGVSVRRSGIQVIARQPPEEKEQEGRRGSKSNFDAPDDRRTVQNWSRSIPHRVMPLRALTCHAEGTSDGGGYIDQMSY